MTKPEIEKSEKDRSPQESPRNQQEAVFVQDFRDLVDIGKHDEALTLLPRVKGFSDQKLVPLINIGYARPDLRDRTFQLLSEELGKCTKIVNIFFCSFVSTKEPKARELVNGR